jgi:putative lipoprotein
LALGALLWSGCSPNGFSDLPSVSGSVTYRERIALPDDAVVQVKLVDTSKQDVAAEALGEQVIQCEGRQAPFAFEIEYEPDRIEPNHTYQVQARITDGGGKLLFISTTAYPVITRGAPTQGVEVIVEKVG